MSRCAEVAARPRTPHDALPPRSASLGTAGAGDPCASRSASARSCCSCCSCSSRCRGSGTSTCASSSAFLRDAQERTLAGTAQAVAIALHDRPRLFAAALDPIASFARDRANERSDPALPPSASPEIAQILQGLSRTTARIWVIDRDGGVLRACRIAEAPRRTDGAVDGARGWQAAVLAITHPLYR